MVFLRWNCLFLQFPKETLYYKYNMSQRTITHIVRLVRPAKTQISLRLRASWSESSLITCTLYNLWAIQRGIHENPCHTGWMFRLIWVFAGHTGLFVGFVRWLKLYYRTIWIATSENAPSDMCAQWRFSPACTLAQSDKNFLLAHLW